MDQCDSEAAKLLDLLADDGVPSDCKPQLRQALQSCSAKPCGPSVKRLREQLGL